MGELGNGEELKLYRCGFRTRSHYVELNHLVLKFEPFLAGRESEREINCSGAYKEH